MKKLYLSLLAALTLSAASAQNTDQIDVDGKQYPVTVLQKRDIGPGTTWMRLRMPTYPLNVNLVTMDVSNPNVRVETMVGNEQVGKTESIVAASKRMSVDGKQVIAGANGNFWCVSNQAPWSDLLIGTPFGGSVRNGKIVTETNAAADQWCGGPAATCVIASDNQRLWIEPMLWAGTIQTEKTGNLPVTQVNKVVRTGEIGLYNGFYPATKAFQPVHQDGSHFVIDEGMSTEVYLKIDEGQAWNVGGAMMATVTKVNTGAGRGSLGDADFVLVANGAPYADQLAKLAVGDKLSYGHQWVSYADGSAPKIDNLLQGLSLVMKDGVQDRNANQGNSYNNQVYPKTGYGCSADKKTLYIITIDKSTDPVYGQSAGCPSNVMCSILAHYGCSDAATVDAGGSTEMLVLGNVVNRTTEGNPRPIANGWFVVSTAPEDNVITRLAFDDYQLKAPVYSSYTPRILGYNQYGTLVDDDVKGFTLTCDAAAGTCKDMTLNASGTPGTYTLTATLDGVSVSKDIEIMAADFALRINPIIIDKTRKYPIEVSAEIDGNVYNYNPANIAWTVSDPAVAAVDAEGILTGLKNGTTELTGTIGDHNAKATVRVEISDAALKGIVADAQTAENWSTSATAVKPITLTATGTDGGFGIDYKITGTRGTKFSVKPKEAFECYSLPDAIRLVVNPGNKAKFKNVAVSMQPANTERPVTVTVTPTLEADKDNEIVIPMTEFGDPADLAFFPVKFVNVTFTPDNTTGQYHIDLNALQAQYNNYAEAGKEYASIGTGYMTDDMITGLLDLDPVTYQVEIQQATDGTAYYRVMAPYGKTFAQALEDNCNKVLTPEQYDSEGKCFIDIDATNPDDVIFHKTMTGVNIGSGELFIGVNSLYNVTMKDGIITAPIMGIAVGMGESAIAGNRRGKFRIAMPGVEIPDFDVKLTPVSQCLTERKFKGHLTVGDAVKTVRYHIIANMQEDEMLSAVNQIAKGGAEFSARGDIELEMSDGTVKETVIMVGLDVNGKIVGYDWCSYYYIDEDPANWTDCGEAEFTDGFLQSLIQNIESQTTKTRLQKSVKDPGMYRLVNPYAGLKEYASLNKGHEGHNHYITINAKDPELIYFEESPIGLESTQYGLFRISSAAAYYLGAGFEADECKLLELGGVEENGMLTFPTDESLLFSMLKFDNGDWYNTDPEHVTKIKLPEGFSFSSGVSDIVADGDSNAAPVYYNLQGQPVSYPEPGTLYIRVSDGRATKVVAE